MTGAGPGLHMRYLIKPSYIGNVVTVFYRVRKRRDSER